MADNSREEKGKRDIVQPMVHIEPAKKIFFMNDDIVKVIHSNKSNNIITFYNMNKEKIQTMLYSDFQKHKKRAYRFKDSTKILNISVVQLNRHIASGLVKPPKSVTPSGRREFKRLSFYSETDLFELREILSTVHIGRPRKDGKVTNHKIPTERELRSRIGDAIMLYTKTKSGEYIPVWEERAL